MTNKPRNEMSCKELLIDFFNRNPGPHRVIDIAMKDFHLGYYYTDQVYNVLSARNGKEFTRVSKGTYKLNEGWNV